MDLEEARAAHAKSPDIATARVIYRDRYSSSDGDLGTISSVNDHYVFVKFDRQVNKLGWTGTTSQACDPADLELEP